MHPLTKLRVEYDISQEQLANEIDAQQNSVSKWEICENMPTPRSVGKIARFFNKDVEELFKEFRDYHDKRKADE